MKFRATFEARERNKESSHIEDYIRGGSSENSPIFSEALGGDPVAALEEKERSAKAEMAATPGNVFLRQKWLYYACVLRDFKYSRLKRRKIKALGLNGLFMENYGGAKIAADSMNKK